MTNLFDKMISQSMWKIFGDFHNERGTFYRDSNKIGYETSKYLVETEYKEDALGVFKLSGRFTAKENITIRNLDLLLNLGGGEFEIYSQFNGWQNESRGLWQKLNTSVLVEGKFSRTSSGAVPFMALWNNQTRHGVVIHLLPDFAWEMKASYVPDNGEFSNVVIEVGINKENLSINLKNGDGLRTPELIFYEFTNKIDMDCWKLHNWWHKNYGKKPIPITYNTWLYNFDKISYENVSSQIDMASELGVEYFVIDAGWFGKGDNWWDSRGDWNENLTGGLCGGMSDISNKVRTCGMKFGLWLEIESASINSDIVKMHPDFFIVRDDLCFLDFSNKMACKSIIETTSDIIEKYNIEYIKFDYNQDMFYDDKSRAFIDYFEGYFNTIKIIKSKYPNVFFENCASGGQRMNLRNCIDFDGFWPSDNESPYEQLKMFKEMILRIPPQYIDKWVAIRTLENFEPIYAKQESEKILSSNDATWDGIVGVHKSFLYGFLLGGQLGLSCDLSKLSDDLVLNLKMYISNIKSERDFWDNAVCRILSSTDEFFVIEFSDMFFDKIKIIAFSYKVRQNKLYVYPSIDEKTSYYIKEMLIDGKEISSNGIEIEIEGNYRATCVELKKCR